METLLKVEKKFLGRYKYKFHDWECARYTKPDKPLNARETMEKYYPEYRKHVELILEELGL